ncbi:hypothetical protein DYU11_13790 [Fibrisoma montanum]|uniref:Uncharacterized protein n=1 Tax=Fibrisoma montanum TaxID=2305895 RepID=A0A418MCD0_9BACT|nr:hypothetical protein [Fibrisoma montanum]RIV24031.1 hypothetical protein DYU11_13790 [Fibrisoma montanum]
MQENVSLPKPEVLLRLMLYHGISRHSATQLCPDAWTDFDTATGPTFQYGTEHTLTVFTPEPEQGCYVVAMIPYLRHVTHPDNPGLRVPLITIYFADRDLWPLFDPLTEEDLSPLLVNQRETSGWSDPLFGRTEHQ